MADVDPSHWRELDAPRVPALTEEEMNPVTRTLAKGAGRVVGGPPPNIFLTLGKHPRLFAPWLAFAAQMMPRGSLPREDTELVILRVAWNTRCRYEWDHHVRIGLEAGLDDAAIERVAEGPEAEGWSGRQASLLTATDELHSEGMLSDGTYAGLASHLDEKLLVEFCMLVGHYEMLAMTLLSLGVQPEQAKPSSG
ncbi:MAG: carboxymuconolactone decarboxylase family protein [Solirubrobacterales bacterium]